MSCYCKCTVALPQGAVGGSAVCDCVTFVFPDHTHLLIDCFKVLSYLLSVEVSDVVSYG